MEPCRSIAREMARAARTLGAAALSAVVACAAAGFTTAAALAGPAGPDSLTRRVQPRLDWRVDAPLTAAGLSLLAVSRGMEATPRLVPPSGLDRSEIGWSFDRASLGRPDARADGDSDRARDAASVFPLLVAFAFQPTGARVEGTIRRAVLYQESMWLAGGLVALIKNSADRPRPYTYLPVGERPDDPAYDVTGSDAFRSMPSGHAGLAFCGAAFAMTDHLLTRPDAGRLERVGVPFVGGALAGMTAALRVESGMHFPSDVIVSGLIGASSGVAVPLAHRYLGAEGRRAPMPSRREWLGAFAGLLAGTGTGVLLAEAFH